MNTLMGKFVLFICVSVFICCAQEYKKKEKSIGKDRNLWIFIMAGQSNMAGRGKVEPQDLIQNNRILTIDTANNWIPAKEPLHFYEPRSAGLDCGLSFANTLLAKVPDSISIAVIPCAVGGSSIDQWLNNSEHRGVKLLSNFQEKVNISNQKGIIKGILWHQGERNANPQDINQYKDSLTKLLSVFRNYTQEQDLPIILGELARFNRSPQKGIYFSRINEIIHAIADEDPYTYWISSEGLTDRGDNLHFNSKSQRELGRRYAMKYYQNAIK